jgi:SOS-response transcriptional repressor LexA
MNNSVNERLKLLRTSLRMKNQTEFAEKLGITQTSLSKYENGTVDIPDEVKVKISKFGINLHWLITGHGEMFLEDQPEKSLTIPKIENRSSPGALIDQRLEKLETEIAEIKVYLKKSGAKAPDSSLYVLEPAPEYGDGRVKTPFVDDIAAGPPIQQSEDLSGYINVPKRFIKTKPEDYYAAHIRGESMTVAGIPDGCTVLIRRSDVPRDGAIQVVRRGGSSTLKRMREGEDHTWTLHFEDGSNWSIAIGKDEDYQVQGDFVAVLPEK